MLDAPSTPGLRPPVEGAVPACSTAPGVYGGTGPLARLAAEEGGVVPLPVRVDVAARRRGPQRRSGRCLHARSRSGSARPAPGTASPWSWAGSVRSCLAACWRCAAPAVAGWPTLTRTMTSATGGPRRTWAPPGWTAWSARTGGVPACVPRMWWCSGRADSRRVTPPRRESARSAASGSRLTVPVPRSTTRAKRWTALTWTGPGSTWTSTRSTRPPWTAPTRKGGAGPLVGSLRGPSALPGAAGIELTVFGADPDPGGSQALLGADIIARAFHR